MKTVSVQIKTLPVGQLKANCYLVWDETNEALIIDPGDDADFIIKNILDEELTPRLIVATHGHFDHIMAALELQLAFKIPFFMHEKDLFLLDRMDSSAKYFTGFDPGPSPDVDKFLKDKAEIKVGNMEFKIIYTPGHTPGCVSIYCKAKGAVFVGDLIFADKSVGRTDFKYSSAVELSKSIRTISKLPKGTTVYPGHGVVAAISEL